MIGKKAQAAMEFLMTYGWAILVVLVVIGALAYFGVLSPGRLLPDRCTLPPGVTCEDYTISGGVLTMIVSNGLGDTIYLSDFSAESPDGTTKCLTTFVAGAPVQVANGGRTTLKTAVCGPDALVERAKQRLQTTLTYSIGSSTGLAHTMDGDVYTTVQP